MRFRAAALNWRLARGLADTLVAAAAICIVARLSIRLSARLGLASRYISTLQNVIVSVLLQLHILLELT
jgi:hypothetical protein